jgi:hypothetical protein
MGLRVPGKVYAKPLRQIPYLLRDIGGSDNEQLVPGARRMKLKSTLSDRDKVTIGEGNGNDDEHPAKGLLLAN